MESGELIGVMVSVLTNRRSGVIDLSTSFPIVLQEKRITSSFMPNAIGSPMESGGLISVMVSVLTNRRSGVIDLCQLASPLCCRIKE